MKISMIPNKIVKLIHASKGDTSLRKWAFEPYDNNGAINVSNIKDQLVYKTENGGTEQLLPTNGSTPVTSPFDGTINYSADEDVEFFYKQSNYSGQASVKNIKGNTLVWNQLVESVETKTADGITTSFDSSTGLFSITNNSRTTNFSSGSNSNVLVPSSKCITGHKYLINIDKVADGVTIHTGSQQEELPVIMEYNGTSGFYIRVTYAYDFVTAHPVGNVFSFHIYISDLTQMFGSGNELTIDEFTSLFSLSHYAYGQYLLNFNGTGIKTVGFNQWDEEWEVGNINSTTGQNEVVNNCIRSKNYIPLLPNTTYYFYGAIGNSGNVKSRYYDANFNYLGSSPVILPDNAFTPPSDARYYRFALQSAYGIVYKNDICINISSSKNGTYEPYTTSTTSLPISTYFPTGMKSAGSVYDELSDKAITRVGSVDLGSLNWAYKDSGTAVAPYFYTDFNGIKYVGNFTTVKGNILCSKYETVARNTTDFVDKTICIDGTEATQTVTQIQIKDLSYTDATTFKSAMSGVYLNYELATYTETDIQNASLVCKNIEVPCYLSNGNLVCDATEELTNESGFFDAKLKLKDSSSVAYSSKFKLHVEDL